MPDSPTVKYLLQYQWPECDAEYQWTTFSDGKYQTEKFARHAFQAVSQRREINVRLLAVIEESRASKR